MADDGVHPDEMQDPLDAFLDDLRQAAAETPAPAVGDALATLFRDGTAPVVAPAPRRRPSGRLRVAVAGAVSGAVLGTLGVAGALPAPVQQRVAGVADVVGVHLPDGQSDPTTPATPPPVIVPLPSTAQQRSGTSPTAADRGGRDGGSDAGPGTATTTTLDERHRVRDGRDRGRGDANDVPTGTTAPDTRASAEDDRSGPGGADDTNGTGSDGSGSGGSDSSGEGSGRNPTTTLDVDHAESGRSGHGSGSDSEG